MRDLVSELASDGPPLLGTVVAIQANYSFVRLDGNRGDLLCTCRSRLKKIGQRVMVGDRVMVDQPDWEGKRGAISQLLPRTSELDRPPVANADQILLVTALAQPALDMTQLSRFLVKAESTGLAVCLALSKCDLLPIEEQQAWGDRIQAWGYKPVLLSVYQGKGLDTLADRLRDSVTVISGPSGVGKSSLINALIPEATLRVSAVSGKLERGRHTTRHVELFDLPGGGTLADTPGFNQPDLTCSPEQLAHYFPEIRSRLAANHCQFHNCLHRDEPGCAVRGDWERYGLYLNFLEEAIAQQVDRNQQSDPDAALKQKSKRKGEVQFEPRLAAKYRQESRRTQKQSMQVVKGRLEDLLIAEEDEF